MIYSNYKKKLEHLKQNPRVEVLIIGGGINGIGLFRELALQNIQVVLAEKNDFCSAASAASSRLIHGGLRYLEFGEFKLVREAVNERNLLLLNAPHYVEPLATTIPFFDWTSGIGSSILKFFGLKIKRPKKRGAFIIKIGLIFYELYTRGKRIVPKHTFRWKKEAREKYPLLRDTVAGALTYYDALITYPERLGLEIVLDTEALGKGCYAINYLECIAANKESVTLKHSNGEILNIRPKIVVNATGAWIDFTNNNLNKKTHFIGGTKGSHLVVKNEKLKQTVINEMIYYENEDGRTALIIPWIDNFLIGTTDIKISDPDNIVCEQSEIEYMRDAVQEVFPDIDIKDDDIISTISGVRPLPTSHKKKTVAISRNHSFPKIEIDEHRTYPVYSMVSGKWSTFRAFAEQLCNKILNDLDKKRIKETHHEKIGGGKNFPNTEIEKQQWINKRCQENGITENYAYTLLERYGTRADEMYKLGSNPFSYLQNSNEYLKNEIINIIDKELVLNLDDLVLRRTAMALQGELTSKLLYELAEITADRLNWDKDEKQQQVQRTLHILQTKHSIVLK